jgi:(E)-4-hydroxy-3-methylbut-2-enyl-diphosphate synthase
VPWRLKKNLSPRETADVPTTRQIHLGSVAVGGGAPISVQSMTNTDTRDAAATLAQIERLAEAGCEIVRCAVPDLEAARRAGGNLPGIAAAAHRRHSFRLQARSYRLGERSRRTAPESRQYRRTLEGRGGGAGLRRAAGADPHRRQWRLLEKELLAKYGHPTAEAMVESALGHIRILEDLNYRRSRSASRPRIFAAPLRPTASGGSQVDYPLHIGITEAGTTWGGTIKSAIGIWVLLFMRGSAIPCAFP